MVVLLVVVLWLGFGRQQEKVVREKLTTRWWEDDSFGTLNKRRGKGERDNKGRECRVGVTGVELKDGTRAHY